MADVDSRVRDAAAPLAGETPVGRKVWTSPRVIRGTMASAQVGIDVFPDDGDGDTIANNYS